ncbi:MAG: sigma-70 family RNA polymerase sigma factor [Clostridium sp.]|uniref:sigma-70 family RNA polymerase sigma factor n=1 Tax=Clostridium sp. TaxID=1506 RepID=UPI003F3374DD
MDKRERLIKASIKGNDEAFLELIDTEKENLYRTAFAYVKNEDAALDVVQETVYKVYISIDKIKNPKFFKTWITRILINNALDYMKKNSNIIYLENNELINTIKDKEYDQDENIHIWEAIQNLDEKHKEVIILKYFDDLTISEISSVLGYPVGTVKTYLNKGLNGLKKFMGREIG